MATKKTATEAPASRPIRGIEESAEDYAKRLDAYIEARNARIREEA